MAYTPRRQTTINKYRAIQQRYTELYEKKRKRLDDVIEQLRAEFFIEHEDTLFRILRTDVPDEQPNQQLDLF